MAITYINDITVFDFNNLRKIAGWEVIENEQAITGLRNSAFKLTAKDGEKTVGLARVIRDGGYVVVVSDVIVLPEYQGKGIGRAMMEKVMTYINDSLKTGQSVFVIVISAHNKEHFYTKFGFNIRPNENDGPGLTQWINKQ
jgi:GNAT superfamily N-acetyltransferase